MRLTYTEDPPSFPSNPTYQSIVDSIVEDRKDSGLGLGALYRTLFISPTFTKAFHDLFGAIRYASTVPADLRELAMCRVGALNGAAFEWAHHAPLLSKAGVSDEGLETVRTAEAGKIGKDGEGGLDGRQWAVMRYTDAMTKDVRVDEEVFEAVRKELGNDERVIVELSMVFPPVPGMTGKVAWLIENLAMTISGYNAVSRFLRALDVSEMMDTEVGKGKLTM